MTVPLNYGNPRNKAVEQVKLPGSQTRGGVGGEGEGGGWLIWISSDGDKFFDFPGFFGVGKSGKYFFGWLDLIGDFFGYSKQSNVRCKDMYKHSISNIFYFYFYII